MGSYTVKQFMRAPGSGAMADVLSPLAFLPRTAGDDPEALATVHGPVRRSWSEVYDRCRRFAGGLRKLGIARGDTVAVLAPNIPALLEAHFAIPATGAVLCALNTRLNPEEIAYVLSHSRAKLVIVDRSFADALERALHQLDGSVQRPLCIDIADPEGPTAPRIGSMTYDDLLASSDDDGYWSYPKDEWDAVSVNYTSGTTAKPKGVVYHHRGAFLNAVGNIASWNLQSAPCFLWTLPMFHCNGWCFPWTITALAGAHVCLREVTAETIFRAISDHEVSHMCGSPAIMGLIANAAPDVRRPLRRTVDMMVAGAPPPIPVIEKLERSRFRILHVYGLTEVFGPVTVCAPQDHWTDLPLEKRAHLQGRQGVPYLTLDGLLVADPTTFTPVPRDGRTMGEVLLRGNTVMWGYLNDADATRQAFAGGWFHTGDLGVMHADGYLELLDRSKDIIIRGTEHISTVELENILYRHEDVLEAAVVAQPDERWGEVPCAFVDARDGSLVDEGDLIAFCRQHLPPHKCPARIVFRKLPKTTTGKVQKFLLRRYAKEQWESQSNLRSTIEALEAAVVLWDRDHRLLLSNQRLAEMFPKTVHVFDIGTPRRTVIEAFLAAGYADSGNIVYDHRPHSLERTMADGRVIAVRARPTETGGSITLYTDITADKQAASKAAQMERLAALGGLVAGLAHELNTPIGVGVTSASIIRETLEALSRAMTKGTLDKRLFTTSMSNMSDSVRLVEDSLTRMSGLVRTFKKMVAGESVGERIATKVGVFIRETVRTLGHEIRAHPAPVDVSVQIGDDPDIVTDRIAISQIVTNLLNNALMHAFPEDRGGRITLGTNVDGGTFTLICEDDGVGAPADLLPRLFDPFFTTKRGQGGTGLGLSIIHNLVVDRLGGTVRAENVFSAEGRICGFRVTVRLPVSVQTERGPANRAHRDEGLYRP